MFSFSSPVVLILACVLMGFTIFALFFAIGRELKARGLTAEIAKESAARSGRPQHNMRGLMALAAPFLPVATAVGRILGLDSLRATLAERYARAGYPGGLDDDELIGLGLLLGIPLALPVALILSMLNTLLVPLAVIMLITGPGLLSSVYNSQGNKREHAIARTMPFALDLLVLTMRAGASLQQAMEQVTEDYKDHPIGAEFSAALADLATGSALREAFENMSERLPIPAIRSFCDDLIQGDELGRPLAEVFERQADQSRIKRVQDATDTAGKAKVLVLIPGMLVFIAVLIMLFAPFFVRWYYGGMQM
ncbi:MAG: tight adherence protein C [Planctomycetota bacterium]|jgi:tight adherence protein C